MTPVEIKKLLGKPSFEGEEAGEEGQEASWVLTYTGGSKSVTFSAETRDSATQAALIKGKDQGE